MDESGTERESLVCKDTYYARLIDAGANPSGRASDSLITSKSEPSMYVSSQQVPKQDTFRYSVRMSQVIRCSHQGWLETLLQMNTTGDTSPRRRRDRSPHNTNLC